MSLYFTLNERNDWVKQYSSRINELTQLDFKSVPSENFTEEEAKQYKTLYGEIENLTKVYREKVPVLPLSRCPYTKRVVYHSIDNYGLDGPWWNYLTSVRPIELLPSTYFGLRGALKLNDKVEKTSYEVRPGPEVPYVVTEALRPEGMVAVISHMKVGVHDSYPIFYFSDGKLGALPMNTWAMNRFVYVDRYGDNAFIDTIDETEFTYDFDLEKWLREEKLMWIAPGDSTLTLKKGVNGCPYLNMRGERRPQIVFDGEVTHFEEE
jgi:hypothetical protein